MDNSCGQEQLFKNGECGASRLKFILILAVLAVVAYVGYQYVPVAYQASRFKVAMQDNVDKAATVGQSSEWLRNQLRVEGNEHGIPPNAEITVERSSDGRVQARVQYTRPVALPGYTYLYNFDYTAKSTELLGNK
ncbi:MAG: hypothetical protein ICV68_03020 [Pyrinomonadaceae bacterium]|nr:hypothetical protein [Pyrinomonadaceae bacterium]